MLAVAAAEAAEGWREAECNARAKDRTRQPGGGVRERGREAATEANRLHRRSAPNNDSRPRSVAREPRSREHLSVLLSLCSRAGYLRFEPARARANPGDARAQGSERAKWNERTHKGLTRVRSSLESKRTAPPLEDSRSKYTPRDTGGDRWISSSRASIAICPRVLCDRPLFRETCRYSRGIGVSKQKRVSRRKGRKKDGTQRRDERWKSLFASVQPARTLADFREILEGGSVVGWWPRSNPTNSGEKGEKGQSQRPRGLD